MASYGHPEAYMNDFLWAASTIPWHASSCSQQAPQGLGMLHPAANSHPKATHQ